MNEVSLSGLVNAVLRRFQRDDIENMPIDAPHAQVGLPKWLHKALLEHYPEQVNEIAHNLQQRAEIWLRVNPLKTSLNEYCDLLTQQKYEFEHAGKYSIKLKRAGEISLLPGYQDGFFAVQDYAAQQAAMLLAPEKDDIVLDCCAAPGGKTASLLEYQGELGALYALDLVPKRVERIVENLARLGHSTQFADKLKIVTADASQMGKNDDLPMFDKILLDAPCSATGVIRRHPDIMWLRKMADIDVLVELQTQILEEAWAKLKVGGVLLYATCSILPKENDQQITRFLAKHDNAKLDEITTTQGKRVSTWQILPGQENMDGFFYARLLKC
jgi:16S rRNA (cytosine967-C5)-methyltransferase